MWVPALPSCKNDISFSHRSLPNALFHMRFEYYNYGLLEFDAI
jgi:hypothetical protein